MMNNRKKVAALNCGMFGCVFLGSGDWLMMYGNTAYHGQIYWLTEGVAQIPAWSVIHLQNGNPDKKIDGKGEGK